MSSQFGHQLKISIFGQSHSAGIGVVIDGLPAGEAIDLDAVQAFMARRAPGRGPASTARKEADIPRILSGLWEGRTCGAPLCAVIENTDARSGDYAAIADMPRPAHADFTAHVKYGGANDVRGGGHFSGRLTAPLCFAGAVCAQILAHRGVTIGAHAATIGTTFDESFDPLNVTAEELRAVAAKDFPTISDMSAEAMLAEIAEVKARGDSLGGVIECFAVGLPVGLGEPMFGGVEGRIAQAIFGIPAVKGLEFGSGFYGSALCGSENNDPFTMKGDRIVTTSNNHGGILGGITSGMPLVLRAAIKPTPTLMQEQQTVSLSGGVNAVLPPKGRHDPCIVPRAVPVIEAAVAAVLLDLWLESGDFARGV
ncbi:MAG: chorismate synthase [Clostridia bacterium]|nr:chorismate synthase [Clostridia bacterium]